LLVAVVLLAGFSLAAFNELIILAGEIAHRKMDHWRLLSKENVSTAYALVKGQIWNTPSKVSAYPPQPL
jgi:hypothetical protein